MRLSNELTGRDAELGSSRMIEFESGKSRRVEKKDWAKR